MQRVYRFIHEAASHFGWAFIVIGFLLGMIFFTIGTRTGAPLAGEVAGTRPETVTTVIVPLSVGRTEALAICQNGLVSSDDIITSQGTGKGYIAVFGLERLTWPDVPKGKNLVAILNGEPVIIGKEVMDCLREKAR